VAHHNCIGLHLYRLGTYLHWASSIAMKIILLLSH